MARGGRSGRGWTGRGRRAGPWQVQGRPPIVAGRRRGRQSTAVTIGITFTPLETRAGVIVRPAARADELGIARVDGAEAWGHDAPLLLAEIAAHTTRIGLGTGILSMWGRTPATLAMTAAGLQRISRGRFTLGLGAGSPPLAEGL